MYLTHINMVNEVQKKQGITRADFVRHGPKLLAGLLGYGSPLLGAAIGIAGRALGPGYLRDLTEFAGGGALTRALTACGPERTSLNLQSQIKETFEGEGHNYRVIDVNVDSIRPLNTDPNKDTINAALDKVDHISVLQKQEGDTFKTVLLPSSVYSKHISDIFITALQLWGVDGTYKTDQGFQMAYLAKVFDPEATPEAKMNFIRGYLNIPVDQDAAMLASLTNYAQDPSYNLGSVPPNASVDFTFDCYAASRGQKVTGDLSDYAASIGLQDGLFVPKDNDSEKMRALLKETFMDISKTDLAKPELYKVQYDITTPGKKPEDPPTVQTVTKLEVFYPGDEKSKELGDVPYQFEGMGISTTIFQEVDVPLNIRDSISASMDKGRTTNITKAERVVDGTIKYAWVPNGNSTHKGDIKRVIFMDKVGPGGGIDPYASDVFIIDDNRVAPRVDKGNKNWITNIDATIRQLLDMGVHEVSIAGGLTPPTLALFRLLKGIDPSTDLNDALLPRDRTLLSKLAKMAILGEEVENWGVPIWKGKDDLVDVPVMTAWSFVQPSGFEEFMMGERLNPDPVGAAFQMNTGDIYPIKEFHADGVVSYRDLPSLDGSAQVIGNLTAELIDSVIVINSKDTITKIWEVGKALAPWAIGTIALLIQPETAGLVVTERAIPFLGRILSAIGRFLIP